MILLGVPMCNTVRAVAPCTGTHPAFLFFHIFYLNDRPATMAHIVREPPQDTPTVDGIRSGRLVARHGSRAAGACRTLPRGLPAARRESGASASSGKTAMARWSRPPTVAARASASIRSRRSRWPTSTRARRCSRSARRAATSVASSARTGGPPNRATSRRLARRPTRRRSPKPPCDLGCRSVAFTYNDPIVWAEYAIDTARPATGAASRRSPSPPAT